MITFIAWYVANSEDLTGWFREYEIEATSLNMDVWMKALEKAKLIEQSDPRFILQSFGVDLNQIDKVQTYELSKKKGE